MMAAEVGLSIASTSRAKPSILQTLAARNANLPSKPRLAGDFKTQDDFISFADLDEDLNNGTGSERAGNKFNGSAKGKGRAIEGEHRGRKRPIADVLEEQGKTRLKDTEKTTPWAAEVDWDSYPSATEQLTAEIKAFSRYIQPTDQEHDLRTCVVESIRRLIVKRWPNAQLHPFGSFMTRLYLPTGDIDLVCVIPSLGGPENKGPIRSVLYTISTMLRSSQLGKDIIVIGKARVPIIKFTSVQGGFKVDISVNMTNSIKVYPRVLQLFEQVGEETARALIMITKAFLNQRQMNEVHTGGLGSYSIICLVCSFLQMHPKLQRKEISPSDNLGTILIEFLEVYGKNFNYDEVGICLSGKGSYYSKTRRGWQSDRRGKLTLSIEDPADPTNDVSSGSYNMNLVRQSISGAFEVLTASVYYRTSIILARLANQQSGVRLNTLSGRAIPHATGEEGRDSDIDECRKSLLGAILGVTSAVEKSRNDLKRLAELGTVQRSLGLPVKEYDEEGMLLVPGQPRKHKEKNDRPRYTNTNHIRFAPEPSEPPPNLPLPPKPTTQGANGQNGHPKAAAEDEGSDMEMGTPPAAAAEPPPAKRQKLIDLTTPSPDRKAKKQKAKPSKTFINLDSPSPPPEPAVDRLPSPAESTHTLKEDDGPETDSRYSVRKGKKPVKPAKVTYVAEALDESSSSSGEEGQASDSSVVISTDSEEAVEAKQRPKPVMRKSGGSRREESQENLPRTRSRTMSQTNGQRPSLANGRTTSSSNSRAATKSPKKPEASAATVGEGKGKADKKASTGPSKPVINSQTRRDYWQAKGSTTHHISSEESSDDDGVYVVSQRAQAKKE